MSFTQEFLGRRDCMPPEAPLHLAILAAECERQADTIAYTQSGDDAEFQEINRRNISNLRNMAQRIRKLGIKEKI